MDARTVAVQTFRVSDCMAELPMTSIERRRACRSISSKSDSATSITLGHSCQSKYIRHTTKQVNPNILKPIECMLSVPSKHRPDLQGDAEGHRGKNKTACRVTYSVPNNQTS